ncbi:DUF3558 domain-containing protein [Saccharothrix obliqua]|uniref:DUF3558 domain-containing protein n=1 Tax=Saccharothrix obliqua TaxID=2861747 RepID=UPI001C5E1042|nr:DUF3558 domain-containing protein [Saccharothrix obliqua]MBW4715658.1 DUF3558 domain-containing protein [Saccharothrix obliqua]
MRLVKGICAVLLTAAALAACTPQPTTGTATPGATTGGGSVEPTSASKAPSTRPKAIKLDGVDPCKLLTDAQQADLKIDEWEGEKSNPGTGTESPSCAYNVNSEKSAAYRVTLVADKGIEFWDGPGNSDVTPKQVSGFPAVQLVLAGTSRTECSVAVDVADGQQMFVQFLPYGGKGAYSQDEMCRNATKGAEAALATLQTLK